MKTYLLWIIALLSIASYSQGKCIAISKKNSERVVTIEEHKRIKIKTSYGATYWGRFTVVDSASIMIEGKIIPLKSIVKIRRKSLFRAIATPVLIVSGIQAIVITGPFIYLYAVGAGAGDLALTVAAMFAAPGVPAIVIPSIIDNHPTSRDWEYAIRSNDKSNPFSNKIKVGQSESKDSPAGGKS